jgi:hypothetical protein
MGLQTCLDAQKTLCLDGGTDEAVRGTYHVGKSMTWVIEYGTSRKATLRFAENARYDEGVE